MPDVKREGNIGGIANPKQSPSSGVSKTSSTSGDEGPITTQTVATEKGSEPNVAQSDRKKAEED